jgi:hypothetical protein
MAITGQINLVKDQTAFFAPIVLGGGKPTTGFVPFTNDSFTVEMIGFFSPGGPIPIEIPMIVTAKANTAKGTFTLPEFPSALNVTDVWIILTHAGQPFYRSQQFKYSRAKEGGLDIYLFQPSLPTSDGIAAGTISKALGGSSLPGNTTLTAKPWGLGVAGSEGQADVQFGVAIVPDTSWNLSSFIDLNLNGWNINVGWPSSWCKSADDILSDIKSGLSKDDSQANSFIKGQIQDILEKPPVGLSAQLAGTLLKNVSVTFTTIVFPNSHEWALSNTTDNTIVMAVHPTLGYPRGW